MSLWLQHVTGREPRPADALPWIRELSYPALCAPCRPPPLALSSPFEFRSKAGGSMKIRGQGMWEILCCDFSLAKKGG